MTPGVLVVAKAPVPGLAKTRLAFAVGATAAADLAAAALLDTLDAVEAWAPASGRLIAMVGDLSAARHSGELTSRLSGWCVIGQRGEDFASRLAHAHHDAAAFWGRESVVVQIGMDTPQLTSKDFDLMVSDIAGVEGGGVDAVLGPASDGGWWALATRGAGYADGLRHVRMSTSDTCRDTVSVLRAAGASVRLAHGLSDVDTLADAIRVASEAPETRFAQAVGDLGVGVAA